MVAPGSRSASPIPRRQFWLNLAGFLGCDWEFHASSSLDLFGMVPVFGFCLRSWINSTFWRRGAITSVMAPISSIKPRRISSCSVLLRVSAMLPLHVSCACAMATFTPERISEGSALDWPGKFQLSSPRPSAPCVSPPCICPWRLPGGGVLRVIFCLDRKLTIA
ncbi:uncharacterized protein LOC117190607 [Drosophila miranda]|uniref:uncharacterized protein LOC117190607 n=1 Tax=Drosophila miranda TaxID=7229 RepID=UPI00143F376F|nr:uncharacterized protein LOC117190607 [Drosophila miranda]